MNVNVDVDVDFDTDADANADADGDVGTAADAAADAADADAGGGCDDDDFDGDFEFDFDGSTGLRNTGSRNDQLLFTLSFCDGLRGDADGLADGRIVDPGAPAFAETEAAEPSVVTVTQSGAMNWAWLLLGLLATAARSRGQRQAPR